MERWRMPKGESSKFAQDLTNEKMVRVKNYLNKEWKMTNKTILRGDYWSYITRYIEYFGLEKFLDVCALKKKQFANQKIKPYNEIATLRSFIEKQVKDYEGINRGQNTLLPPTTGKEDHERYDPRGKSQEQLIKDAHTYIKDHPPDTS